MAAARVAVAEAQNCGVFLKKKEKGVRLASYRARARSILGKNPGLRGIDRGGFGRGRVRLEHDTGTTAPTCGSALAAIEREGVTAAQRAHAARLSGPTAGLRPKKKGEASGQSEGAGRRDQLGQRAEKNERERE